MDNGLVTGKQLGSFFKSLNKPLPHDPWSPFFFPQEKKKAHVHIQTRTQVFIAALFEIAKMQTQARCPITGECVKNLCCVHTAETESE